MSALLIDRSHDLSRLREEGYEVDVRHGHVVVTNVPYVDSSRCVRRGMLIVALTTSGESTGPPPDHTVWWTGDMPCHCDGTPIQRMDTGQSGEQALAPDLVANRRFSSKPLPAGSYGDYYEQFTAYIRIISSEARELDPDATAATFAPVAASAEESVFVYHDSASSRAGIRMAAAKLELERVAIVGLGGTGSYVLDLVSKAPVREIHLFDGDQLLNHNAFRMPGAISLGDLDRRPLKVDRFAEVYGQLRRGVVPHPYALDGDNPHELAGMDFVFLCMDGGSDKKAVVTALETMEIPFVDTGMGLHEEAGEIAGIVRLTLSSPGRRSHVWKRDRITFDDPDGEHNEYSRNIQIAELNALNACLAVIRWKKYFGFYRDLEEEFFSLYTVDGNHLLNQEIA